MIYPRGRHSRAKEIYYIVCIVLLAVITAFSIWGPGGYLEMKKARRELEARRMRVEALKRSNQERMQAIEALRYDTHTLEELARKNGYGKKGEIVQQLPEETKPKTDDKKH
jgi:cell division protein FtsB